MTVTLRNRFVCEPTSTFDAQFHRIPRDPSERHEGYGSQLTCRTGYRHGTSSGTAEISGIGHIEEISQVFDGRSECRKRPTSKNFLMERSVRLGSDLLEEERWPPQDQRQSSKADETPRIANQLSPFLGFQLSKMRLLASDHSRCRDVRAPGSCS